MKFYIGRSIGQHITIKQSLYWKIFDKTNSCHINIGEFYFLLDMDREGMETAFHLSDFFRRVGLDMAETIREQEDLDDQYADIREEEDGIAEAVDIQVEQSLDDVEVADA